MLNPIIKNNIFGVKETSLSNIKGMKLRYKVVEHENSDPAYLEQQVLRDEDGNYFLHVKGGTRACIQLTKPYPLNGKELLIPMARESLYDWAEFYLSGEECACALEEFKENDMFQFKKVWQYQSEAEMGQPGHVCEFFLKTSSNGYILFSTDASYPCFARNMPWIPLDEDGSPVRDDLYMYYVTSETARRWAKMRGMDEHTCQAIFEY